MVENTDTRRLARVGEAIRAQLSKLLLRDVRDPSLSWATITGVKVSSDLKHAKVYFAAAGAEDESQMQEKLTKAAPFLQRELGASLDLKYTPKLAFIKDESFETGHKIEKLIMEVQEEQSERSAGEPVSRALDRLVSDAGRILLATHRNPDGDALGSLFGLSRVLSLMGKNHIAYCPDEIPSTLAFLPGAESAVRQLDAEDRFDLTIILDTADESLLPDGFPSADIRGTLAVIDHHKEFKEIGDVVIRRETSAVGEILYNLCKELVWPMDEKVAECFYTSIVADTGSFRYSSTNPETFKIASELLVDGARPWFVATHLYESYPFCRHRLLSKVLNTLELSEDGRFAQMFSTPQMLAETGATKGDLDGMINFGRAINGVEIAAMFRLEPNSDIKISFRSKDRVDVSSLAAKFGGGGHVNAAGCTLKGTDLNNARKQIMEAAISFLKSLKKEALESKQ